MVANTVASRKGKARKLQNFVTKNLQEIFETDDNDIKSVPMGVSGIDVWVSNCIRDKHPYGYECKCQEKLSFWGAMKQCVINAEDESLIPILVFKKNYRLPHVMIRYDDIDLEGLNIVYEIESKKLNVWSLIDEYIKECEDCIVITRGDDKYAVISCLNWFDRVKECERQIYIL